MKKSNKYIILILCILLVGYFARVYSVNKNYAEKYSVKDIKVPVGRTVIFKNQKLGIESAKIYTGDEIKQLIESYKNTKLQPLTEWSDFYDDKYILEVNLFGEKDKLNDLKLNINNKLITSTGEYENKIYYILDQDDYMKFGKVGQGYLGNAIHLNSNINPNSSDFRKKFNIYNDGKKRLVFVIKYKDIEQ